MTALEVAVVAAAVGGIAWINWFFFLSTRRGSVARAGADGAQEVTVAVSGGYDPGVIEVRKGVPVRITFDRQETSGCSEEVVFPAFGVRRFLPAFERTVVELVPEEAGSFGFTCGMSMLQGRLLVKE